MRSSRTIGFITRSEPCACRFSQALRQWQRVRDPHQLWDGSWPPQWRWRLLRLRPCNIRPYCGRGGLRLCQGRRQRLRVLGDCVRLEADSYLEGLQHRRRPEQFGNAVAISGSTIIVGAGDHADHSGAAYVFSEKGSTWKQSAILKGSNTAAGDYFGWSVAVSGATALVGAYGYGASAGRAYVFSEKGSTWKQSALLKGSNTAAGDQFGSAVALSGTTAVVAATSRAGAAGRAYVFTKKGSDWTQSVMLKGSNTVAGDHFGWSFAISGSTVVVGGFATLTSPAVHMCSPRRGRAGPKLRCSRAPTLSPATASAYRWPPRVQLRSSAGPAMPAGPEGRTCSPRKARAGSRWLSLSATTP